MAGRSDATGHPGWVCVGAFAGAHGVRGQVRLKSFTDEPSAIGRFKALHKGPDGAPVRLTLVRPVKGAFVARVDGVSDRDAAEVPEYGEEAGAGARKKKKKLWGLN